MKMHIFVRAHTIYNVFALIGQTTLRVVHNAMQLPSQVTKHCNRHIIYTCEGTQTLMGWIRIYHQI